jgi:hypothetical protein
MKVKHIPVSIVPPIDIVRNVVTYTAVHCTPGRLVKHIMS